MLLAMILINDWIQTPVLASKTSMLTFTFEIRLDYVQENENIIHWPSDVNREIFFCRLSFLHFKRRNIPFFKCSTSNRSLTSTEVQSIDNDSLFSFSLL